MITLKIAYDDSSEELIKKLREIIPDKYVLVKMETYHEGLFKERKKAFKLKGGFSARKSPFAVLIDENNKIVKAFYSESNECSYENIIKALDEYIIYKENLLANESESSEKHE